jgi:site-specific DNA recombinase
MKACIYTRVSSPGQATADAASLEAQERIARGLAERDGMREVEHYQDAGKSATKDDLDNRPAMQRLLRDAAAGKFAHLYCYHEDRLARNVEVAGIIAANLRRAGVTIHTQRGTLDLDQFGGRLLYYVSGLWAEEEARRIRERCDNGKRQYAERGDFAMYQQPFGYRWEEGDLRRGVPNRLHAVPEEVEIIREAFRLVDDGKTAHQATVLLNERGLVSRSGAKWHASSVARMLRDERYCGRWPAWRAGEEVYYARPELCPEPAVSEQLWRRVQGVLARHRHRTRRPMKHAFLLNGFLFCADCGSPMVGHAVGKEPALLYYQCTERDRNVGHTCRGRYVPADPLNRAALALLEELAADPETGRGYAEALRQESLPDSDAELGRIDRKLQDLKAELDGFLRMRAAGEITAEELVEHRRRIADSREAWEQRRQEAIRMRDDAEWRAHACESVAALARRAVESSDLAFRRSCLQTLGVRVTLGCKDWSAKSRERRYSVDIVWAGEPEGEAGARDYEASPKARWMYTAIWSRVTGLPGPYVPSA